MPAKHSSHDASHGSPNDGLPVAPSMAPTIAGARLPHQRPEDQRRLIRVTLLACGIAVVAALAAELLLRLIGLVTNVAFYGRLSAAGTSPAGNHLGLWVVLVPAIGGIIVGLMARFGSPAIRGHGIPEAMERILLNDSRIAPRVTLLKPLSAAVAIGTGGPFGAEGPIIATGGALGSLAGQVLAVTADERKVLLAAGAAAGMAATFGSPLAAVLLAIELLLFEYRARSLIPVALASSVATAIRMSLHGAAPVFAMPAIAQPGGVALLAYVILGTLLGVAAVGVTRAVYAVEDAFEHLPVSWMWWPAIGGLVVGAIGFIAPHTLGVGYDNIDRIVTGSIAGPALAVLVALKFVSWAIALGSGTSGGTLAPLFTIGGGIGSLLGAGFLAVAPTSGLDVRVAGLVGMAAMFAGASRAPLTSIIFAFETTRQPMGLLPLLAGCSAAYLVSLLCMRNSIMTERLVRRGTPIGSDYSTDYLGQLLVEQHASREVVTLRAEARVEDIRGWLAEGADGASHQGFPVLDESGALVGVLTRRDFGQSRGAGSVRDLIHRPVVAIYPDNTLRDAADHMVRERVGRLPVISRAAPHLLVGILSRSDLLEAHARRLEAMTPSRSLDLWRTKPPAEQA